MYIAIDAGSSFLKFGLIDVSCGNVSVVEKERRAVVRAATPHPYQYEYDVENIAAEVRGYIDRTATRMPVEGILITTQMHGSVLKNTQSGETSNYISWQDERCLAVRDGESSLDRLRRIIPADIIALSGMRLKCEMALCNLYAKAADEGLDLSHGYEVFTLGSYIINSLCGSNVTHITNAVPTGFFRLTDGAPNRELLAVVGMEGLALPQVSRELGPCGEYRTASGVAIPVYPDIGDQQVSMLGGGIDEGSLNINIGTATQMSAICRDPDDGFYGSIYEVRPYFDGRYLRTVTKLPGGRSLQVIAGLFADAVRTFTGAEPGFPEIWDRIMELAGGETTLDVKTGFFCGLLFNEGAVKNIDSSNLTCRDIVCGAFYDLTRVFDGILPVIDPGRDAGRIVICGKFGEVVRAYMEKMTNASAYRIDTSASSDDSFAGLGKLVIAGKCRKDKRR